MSSASTAPLLPSPGPSSASISSPRSVAPRLASSPSSSSLSSIKSAQPRSHSSRIEPSPLAPAGQPLRAAPSAPATSSQPPVKRKLSTSNPSLAAASIAPAATTAPSVPIIKKDTSGPLIQPSKEWVLPARAKPGRKPSETEPLTKRKAQNRASQRAFRERKQSYLADLEAKVAAYEAAEIDRSVEIQKVAQKLSSENDALKKELAVWRDKYAQLEKLLMHIRATGRVPNVVPSVKSGPGCKAPAHEKPAVVPKRGVLVAPGTKPSKDKDRSAGGVRFAEDSPSQQAQFSAAESPAASVPLRRRPSATSSASPQVDSSAVSATSPTSTSASSASASGSFQVHIEKSATIASVPLPQGVKPPLWSFEQPQPSSSSVGHDGKSEKTSSLSSPSLLPEGKHLSVDGGCGFCTEASPCVCADDFLDLPSDSQPSHIAVASDVPSAIPLPKHSNASTSSSSPSATSTARRMSIGSLTHAKDVNLDQRKRGASKLWYTVNQPDSPPRAPTTDGTAAPLKIRRPTSASKAGKKLWALAPAVEPVCTGDPSTCGACQTDPGLAAFCEAVTTAASAPSSSTSTPPPSGVSPSPTRPGMLRSGTTGRLGPSSVYASTAQMGGETIPSAWRQIRSHPRFAQWQGGLDLLAEVVSKRSGNVRSPLLSNRSREDSVEFEPPTSATATTSMATSNDRATSKPLLLHTASDTTIHAPSPVKREQREQDEESRDAKRRRIVVDREAVQEALALLDAGTAAQPRVGPAGVATSPKDEPCPCPWRPGDKHSH